MDLFFRSFEGTIRINNEYLGTLSSFQPISFKKNEAVKNTNLRFRFNRNITHNGDIKYILNGIFKVGMWGRTYSIPVELFGEI